MYASLNVGYQGKSGPDKIHEVILVETKTKKKTILRLSLSSFSPHHYS